MMRAFSFIVLSLLCTSCLVVKVYQSPEGSEPKTDKPHEVHRGMIRSGEHIDLGEKGVHEILFFGNEVTPKGVFIKSGEAEMEGDTLSSERNTWVPKTAAQRKIKIVSTDSIRPLVVIDGKISKTPGILESLDPANIESMNVLKGTSAIEFYGEKGVHGVIEITLKKE